ncbi:CPBP family intramembrane glutamic endopeptidase [Janthinobacterium agaricidamnosum]|uniref:CAAX amino terminal protease family protein n=1 Tax=Janthinobacterium agaricidamnosum NBRC 102515 = DSM 9628 TaxID=1349767 RepID=W0VBG3_9BURK|nr:CPBP family intramembrane glutamic endopeptidase [Janthinobacterium agaricidamnosum]CDG85221.1 CAAX amino terminal protease family protein [Janthinobacterium agaricidamnosum NBRC 102515 = DSM 9628]
MKKSAHQIRKTIATFLLITFALGAIFDFLIIQSGKFPRTYIYGIMWCPALATYLTCRIFNIKISGLAWQWGEPKYHLWAYLTPLIYSSITYIIIWSCGWGGFYNEKFVTETAKSLGWSNLPHGVFIALYFVFQGVIGIFGGMSTALGEEIGWRGFLVPQLSKITSYTNLSLFTGVIWTLYHVPVLIFGDYNNGAPAWYGLGCFTVMLISGCFIVNWFSLKSQSLWPAVMLHASHNLFIQTLFTSLTQENSHSKYFIDEFGIVLALVSVCFAIYFWRRRGELAAPELQRGAVA